MDKVNQTKENIVSTAYRLFRERGYNNVSINDICTQEEISNTTFYYHFKTKEDLIKKFFELPQAVSLEIFQEILLAPNCWAQLCLLTDAAIDQYLAMGTEILSQVIQANINEDKGTFGELSDELMSLSVPLVIKAQSLGEIRNQSDAKQLINAGWRTQFGILTYWCISKGAFDLKINIMQALEVLYDVHPELRKTDK